MGEQLGEWEKAAVLIMHVVL